MKKITRVITLGLCALTATAAVPAQAGFKETKEHIIKNPVYKGIIFAGSVAGLVKAVQAVAQIHGLSGKESWLKDADGLIRWLTLVGAADKVLKLITI